MMRFLRQRWSPVVAHILLALLVVIPVYAASTIGNNISTGGNITLTNGGGNLGVGTSTPANLFSVHGNAFVAGNLTSVANITATGTIQLADGTAAAPAYTFSANTNTGLFRAGSNLLAFSTGGSERARVDGSGNVGIGTTSPTQLLSIQGNALISGNLNSVANITATGTLALTGTTGTTTIASGQGFTVGTNQFLVQQSSGNIGIGSTTPAQLLSVSGNGYLTGGMGVGQAETAAGNLTGTGRLSITSTTATSTFSTGGLTVGTNQFLVQQTSGSIGIGSTTPATTLSVSGSGYLTAGLGVGTLNTTAGTITVLPAANSATVLAVQNAAGSNIFTVDTRSGATTTLANYLNVTGGVTSTSTFTGGLAANLLNLTSTTATSTAANGLNLTAGCFSVSSVCVGPGTVFSGTAGQLPYYGSAGTALTATSTLFLTTSSNLGIGTTTPNWLVQAVGTRPSLALSDSNAGANLKHWLFSSMGGNLYIGTSTDLYATSTPPVLALLNGGSVGLGLAAPVNKLDVNGAAAIGTYAGTAGPSNGLIVSGNVGIGTTTPGTPLGVTGAAVITGTITTPNFAATSTTATSTLSTGGLTVGTTQFLVEQNSGNVGIGRIAPNTKLEVVGTASTTSLIVGGNGTTLNGLISGYCTFPATTVSASTTAYANCTGATGVQNNDRVLVQATSSLADNFIIQSASSTVTAGTINVKILNTGMIAGTATGINSLNFWDFR